MTSQPLYMKPHPVCRATYTLYMWHWNHYLCHHTHCIDNIIPNFCMTSHSPYVWQRLHDRRHHILTLWPQTTVCHHTHYIWHCFHCTCVITSTVLMISHQLNLWDHIRYDSWHHILCIRHDNHCIFTPSCSMISHHLYVWHHTHYMYNIIYPI